MRARERALDEQDELAGFRDRFLPDDGTITAYLDGNSLGRPPKATARRIETFVREQWGGRLARAWDEGWLKLPERAGDRLGEVALGAAAGQVVIGDATTVCLYKLLRAAVTARPGRSEIVADVHDFPTDRYVVEGVAEELGLAVRWVTSDPDAGVTGEVLADALGPDTAVVTVSHVAYRSGFLTDMAEITGLVHESGALVVWDLCHSVGAVPVELDASGADFAVGCTYKYLNAGPGAPAFMYVRAAHQDLLQPVRGWMGRRDPFEMAAGYEPAPGMRRFLSGTPPVLAMLGVSEGTELVAEAGIERIRRKSLALTGLALELVDAQLAREGLTVASPRDPARRGGHVTIRRDDARFLSQRLVDAGVIVDYRPPDGIRLGPSPLTTSFEEVGEAVRIIARTAGDAPDD